MAAGCEPSRWPGGHAPEKGLAPSRRSLAQQMIAHRRCTKEPMAASLCQEVGGMTRAWARAWSAVRGFLRNNAGAVVPKVRAAGKVLEGRGRRLGRRKMGYACTAPQRSERPRRRDTPPRDTCSPLGGPQFTHLVGRVLPGTPMTNAPQHLPWDNLWGSEYRGDPLSVGVSGIRGPL